MTFVSGIGGGELGGGWIGYVKGKRENLGIWLNLPHTWNKLIHQTTFFGHAKKKTQLCLHLF